MWNFNFASKEAILHDFGRTLLSMDFDASHLALARPSLFALKFARDEFA